VEVLPDWSGWAVGVLAQTGNAGRLVRFHAVAVDAASDAEVRFLIAHELAHVWQWAANESPGRTRATERDADARALTWLGLQRRPRCTAPVRAWLHAEYRKDLTAHTLA
jgi:hypothetical protein